MINTKMLKMVISETVPLDLHQKIEPHIDKICLHYEEAMSQYEEFWSQQADIRYRELKDDFNKENQENWRNYAKEHWPEIEKYFNLSGPLAREEKPVSLKLISKFDEEEDPFSRELISNYDGEEAPF